MRRPASSEAVRRKEDEMTTRPRKPRPFLMVLLGLIVTMTTAGCFGHHLFLGIGTAIDVLPHGYMSVTVANVPYYYHRGIFYRPYRRGYVIVPAPLGAVIMGPPPGDVIVMVENDPYHYYRGVFYAPRASRYAVVRPPMGAFVRTVPRAAATLRVEGVEYKEYAGTYYRPAIRDGKTGYQVTEAPRRRPP
jgi:hypothetical protein